MKDLGNPHAWLDDTQRLIDELALLALLAVKS